jgi:hypothetical protein
MDPGDECLAVLRDREKLPVRTLGGFYSHATDIDGPVRPVWPRFRSGVTATAIAFACLACWASTAMADDPGSYEVQTLRVILPTRLPSSLVHLVADKHDDAPVRTENKGSPDPSTDSATPVASKATSAAARAALSTITAATPPSPQPPRPRIIATTYLSQFDGTIWGAGNCGPTSLAMVLSALKIPADPLILRHYANQEMGFADPESGTTWESLAYAAKISGATIKRLYVGKSYRTWTVDDLRAELNQGHPVLLLVRYWNLPDHGTSDYGGDHYIVAVGFDLDGNLVYNDPAFWFTSGDNRTINHDHLMKAWTNTAVGLVRTAMALVAT